MNELSIRQIQLSAAKREIRCCSDLNALYGLTLTEADITELVELRGQALQNTGRVEFGGGILPKLIRAFCKSSYVDAYNYATTLVDLQDAFYYFKNESEERFYAYIKRSSDGAWIGDVNFHYTPEKDWWDMGIVIFAPYRGKGYAVPALKLLLDHAFRVCGISRVHNDFETSRDSAWAIHRKVGFREMSMENGILHLILTKEEYLKQNP